MSGVAVVTVTVHDDGQAREMLAMVRGVPGGGTFVAKSELSVTEVEHGTGCVWSNAPLTVGYCRVYVMLSVEV